MKNALALVVSFVGLGFASTVAVACADPALEPDASSASELTTSLTCKTMTFARGSMGAGQSITTLATKDLTGTQDVWDKYVEFSPNASATCTFSAGTTAPSTLAIQTNYRGPKKSAMVVRFSAWDFAANTWVLVGDNAFAGDWVWSAASLPLPAPIGRFVSPTGEIRIRYASPSTYDASQLDQLVLVASSDGSTPPPTSTTDAGTSTTDASTTTPEASAPPPTTSPTGIWKPAPGTSWQWQLSGTLDTSLAVKMYDIDLFETPTTTISALKAKGIKVICYFSAGSYEKGRPDSAKFPAAAIGNVLDGWPDERWIDTRNATIRTIMSDRMTLAAQKGCDGVEPDNVDGYQNNPGFPLTSATQLDFNKFLATTAHAKNLSIALKNDLDQVSDLVGSFDFAVNEECFQYNECDMLKPFIAANKAVFNVEYVAASQASTLCPKANALNFDTLIKKLDLDAWRVSCR
jgi:hypothetical protein